MSNEIKLNQTTESTTQAEIDDIMKKYDRESHTRIWEGKPKIAVDVVLIFFSLFVL